MNNKKAVSTPSRYRYLSRHLKEKRFLWVDDISINTRIGLKTALKKWHCAGNGKTSIASNGLQASKKYQTYRPHFVVMDIEMPHQNGLEATKFIRAFEKDNHLPPACIIGYSSLPKDQVRWQQYQMTDYVEKPNMAELYRTICKHL